MFRHGHPKYGGRRKGTLNRNTAEFKEHLELLDFNVPQKVVALYNSIPHFQYQLKINLLKMIASYAYSRPMSDACAEQLDQMVNPNTPPENPFKGMEKFLPPNYRGTADK